MALAAFMRLSIRIFKAPFKVGAPILVCNMFYILHESYRNVTKPWPIKHTASLILLRHVLGLFCETKSLIKYEKTCV